MLELILVFVIVTTLAAIINCWVAVTNSREFSNELSWAIKTLLTRHDQAGDQRSLHDKKTTATAQVLGRIETEVEAIRDRLEPMTLVPKPPAKKRK